MEDQKPPHRGYMFALVAASYQLVSCGWPTIRRRAIRCGTHGGGDIRVAESQAPAWEPQGAKLTSPNPASKGLRMHPKLRCRLTNGKWPFAWFDRFLGPFGHDWPIISVTHLVMGVDECH